MDIPLQRQSILKKHIAVPQDHGSWVFLLSPLIIGLFIGGQFGWATIFLILAAMAGFLIRQPVTVFVKVISRRRSRRDLPAAVFWMAVYGIVGLLAALGLYLQDFTDFLPLLIPAVVVFTWHLVLVSKRAERKQMEIEILGSGVLALAAPAAVWLALGYPSPLGWWLFGLTWLQSAASIVYAYLRLEQRVLKDVPDLAARARMGRNALLFTSLNLVLVIVLASAGWMPALLPLAFAVQWLETLHGTLLRPAVGMKPTHIGIRQLIVSTLFTAVFIAGWYGSAFS